MAASLLPGFPRRNTGRHRARRRRARGADLGSQRCPALLSRPHKSAAICRELGFNTVSTCASGDWRVFSTLAGNGRAGRAADERVASSRRAWHCGPSCRCCSSRPCWRFFPRSGHHARPRAARSARRRRGQACAGRARAGRRSGLPDEVRPLAHALNGLLPASTVRSVRNARSSPTPRTSCERR